MNNSLFFEPLFPGWLIIVLIVPLFLFLAWKEFKRPLKLLWWRLLALLLVLIGLLGILFKPGFVQEKNVTGVLLLTPNYNKAQVDSLIRIQPDLRILRLPETETYHNSELIKSNYDLADADRELRFVLGDGIPLSALELMSHKKFQFLPSPAPIGIIQLFPPEKIQANQRTSLHGVFNAENEVMVRLIGPGGAEDSVNIKAEGKNSFTLNFKPKEPGLFVYTIEYKSGSEIKSEQLPIEVMPEEKLTILFLQKFPGFETRQLKNFLTENGHRIALRYQVSKNNYRFEYANLPSMRITPITPSALKSFDLVVVGNEALEALSEVEKHALEEAIHNGLGLLLMNSSGSEKDKLLERFVPLQMKRALTDTAHLNIVSKQYTLPVLPLEIIENPSINPVIKNKKHILSAYTFNGFGKTGIQLLQETYRIALEGNTDAYASLWSPLLEKIARTKNVKYKIKLNNNLPIYQNEPLHIEIISSTDEHPVLKDDRTTLPLKEDVLIDNVWLGTSWAGEAGWHQLTAESSTLNYFVLDNSSWKSLRTMDQIQQNIILANNKLEASKSETIQQRNSIPVWLFYLLFLFASGFLWLAPKI